MTDIAATFSLFNRSTQSTSSRLGQAESQGRFSDALVRADQSGSSDLSRPVADQAYNIENDTELVDKPESDAEESQTADTDTEEQGTSDEPAAQDDTADVEPNEAVGSAQVQKSAESEKSGGTYSADQFVTDLDAQLTEEPESQPSQSQQLQPVVKVGEATVQPTESKQVASVGQTQPLGPTVATNGGGIDISALAVSSIANGSSSDASSQEQAQTLMQQMAQPRAAADDSQQSNLNIARIARALRNGVQQNGGTINIRMTPPDLGMVRVTMNLRNGVVSASFVAENNSVSDMLSNQMGHLRNALQSHGLTIDRIDVNTRTQSTTFSNAQQQFEDATSDGRSRGQYERQNQSGRQSSPDEAWQQVIEDFAQQL